MAVAGEWQSLENGSWRMAGAGWRWRMVAAGDYHSPAPRFLWPLIFLWPLHFSGPYGGVMQKCLPLREILPLFAIICDLAPGYA